MNQIQVTAKMIIDRGTYLPAGKVYGVPKGGMIAAFFLSMNRPDIVAVFSPEEADYILDDLVDSGRTKTTYVEKYGKPFYALFEKGDIGSWLVFPWENTERPAEDAVVRILQAIGEDIKREGLIDTPARVVRSWDKLYGGYHADPEQILSRTFKEKSDQMVLLRDIEIYSTCEHHMLPFYGKAHVAYLPKDKVVGVSKLARLVECFSRRLQIQERLTNQIAQALQENLNPEGVGVIIQAKHFCMTSRGIEKQNSVMVTSALLGSFRNQVTREEFVRLCQ